MASLFTRAVPIAAVAAAALLFAAPASAASRHHARAGHSGVSYSHTAQAGGSQALVSDGPGTGFGFHRLPTHYRIAAAIGRDRQAAAVRSAVVDDAVESYGSGPFYGGLVGEAGFGANGYGNRGVFSYPDGYGSPYFAGYYGPGDGADLGPLGHTYAN